MRLLRIKNLSLEYWADTLETLGNHWVIYDRRDRSVRACPRMTEAAAWLARLAWRGMA